MKIHHNRNGRDRPSGYLRTREAWAQQQRRVPRKPHQTLRWARMSRGLEVQMTNYLVSWEIDIDADSPLDAAERALEIQRRPDSIATVFAVRDETGESVEVDLDEYSYAPGHESPAPGKAL
jgi:hypothetical protein